MKKISIIIPCFNEEESIPQLIEKLLELERFLNSKYRYLFLFVDDGSKDHTYRLLSAELPKLHAATIIKHEVNRNLGAALKTGITNSLQSDYVAFLDSDCTYEPKIILDLISKIEEGHDIATVSPYHPSGIVEGVPEWRLYLSRSLSFLYRLILSTNIYTFTAMVRVIRRDKIQAILSERNDFSFVAEMLLKGIQLNYKISEVPAVLKVRKFGVSKMSILKNIKSHLLILFKLLMSNKL